MCFLIDIQVTISFYSVCTGKYVYQPMTNVAQLPSTPVPVAPSDCTNTIDLSISLTERFLRISPCFLPPPCPESPKYCNIAELFIDDYIVKRINGKMCYVQRPPVHTEAPLSPPQINPACLVAQKQHTEDKQTIEETVKGPKMGHCSSPSSSEDSGINALGGHYLESYEEESEEEDELSMDGHSSPGSLWDQDECTLLSPSKSIVEIIENIETTVWYFQTAYFLFLFISQLSLSLSDKLTHCVKINIVCRGKYYTHKDFATLYIRL